MDNRICEIRIWNARLDPAEAEVWVSIYPAHLTSTTQVRGRLVGPQCKYSSTVEVGYLMREHSRQYAKEGDPRLSLRVIIPEPSLWDPQSPFSYEVFAELWQSGKLSDQVRASHCLCSLKLTPQGIRWNGRPLTLLGVKRERLEKNDAAALRRSSFNTLFVPVNVDTAKVCADAEQLGFLVLARIGAPTDYHQSLKIARFSSCLGFVLDGKLLDNPFVRAAGAFPATGGRIVGVELNEAPAEPLPAEVDFIVCSRDTLPGLERLKLPKLILETSWHDGHVSEPEPASDILGSLFA